MMFDVVTKCYNWWKENKYSQKTGESCYNSWYMSGYLNFGELFLEGNLEEGVNFYVEVNCGSLIMTLGGVNTSRKETKGKKKAEESSDDICRVVEKPVVEVEAQNVNGRKLKIKGKRVEGSCLDEEERG
ncbi:hypothetical protein LIER_27413 [Lithospermum erythrorhizon]|uniref:Uncharacterized protein n=1 Tax=Lithospermum erythrorhizon TaxID=34254 RepID=A0AAV3RFB0_LITER